MRQSNDAMKKIYKSISFHKNMNKYINHYLYQQAYPEFIEYNGCVLVKNNSLSIEHWDWKRLVQMYSDRTGIEWYKNELEINDFLPCTLELQDIVLIAFELLKKWKDRLYKKFPQDKFVFYIQVEKETGFVRMWFHKYRHEEGMMFESVDDFDEPTYIETTDNINS